ncbi:hypothetical protein AGLY_017198 [Aphis glycines]|uniref:Uncharacterized protein n=1 Tax=Aphis glycines TaxID=307491 RepID=A0A6G0SWS2_APHGL|nr:hypothetical protein AGLY_017198 [Aphis glycines]
MLRLQTVRVVFDCKSNVLDAYNLTQNVYVSVIYISEIFFLVSLYNITSRKNAPITNFEVERMLRLQTLRVGFDCKSNVLDAYNLSQNVYVTVIYISEIFFSVSLYNITSRKNAPITNFAGWFSDCKSNCPLDAYNRFTKCLCNCYLCIVEFSKKISEIFFFVSLYNITSRKNPPITNFEDF